MQTRRRRESERRPVLSALCCGATLFPLSHRLQRVRELYSCTLYVYVQSVYEYRPVPDRYPGDTAALVTVDRVRAHNNMCTDRPFGRAICAAGMGVWQTHAQHCAGPFPFALTFLNFAKCAGRHASTRR
jgi:hypothetical protein